MPREWPQKKYGQRFDDPFEDDLSLEDRFRRADQSISDTNERFRKSLPPSRSDLDVPWGPLIFFAAIAAVLICGIMAAVLLT